ncbi:Rz1-like lysis system protein LysC [Serratia marcescens]|uniref:Rz1-like lysis system protein LysC n=1 Tax=Serratia marcescens TaxID=615 RepID=UPI003B9E0811
MTSVAGALLLPLFLASCAEQTPQPPVPLVLLPPESVFTPCEQPKLQGETWGDIGSHALSLQIALSICASKITTLTRWRSEI